MSKNRRRLRLKASSEQAAGGTQTATPTLERRRHAEPEGGVVRLETAHAGVFCHGVRLPLLVDRLFERGDIDDRAHGLALRARDLYERADRRASLTGSYDVRCDGHGPFTAEDPAKEAAAEAYRKLELGILREAGRDAWRTFVAVVTEDRLPTPPAGGRSTGRCLTAALLAAERML